MNVNRLIGRERRLFTDDLAAHDQTVSEAISGARILLIGGAGSIGKEVAVQIFRRKPAALHIIDLSENNLVELVRTLRSSVGYIDGESLFLPIDMEGPEFRAFLAEQKQYDYVLNLAAMKHVRSEKDPFSLMRMVRTNVFDTIASLQLARSTCAKKFFAVSTDKAKNPANLMGATKRIMEGLLFMDDNTSTVVSTARFANVAFSDGSLLHGFRQRFLLRQPLSAPKDIRRYFVTGEESGMLCLASIVLGRSREIFFPNLDAGLSLLTFSEIAVRFLECQGFEAVEVDSEDEARSRAPELIAQRKWPCFFFESDTSGEKPFEEFYSETDDVCMSRFSDIGVIRVPAPDSNERLRLQLFAERVETYRGAGRWTIKELSAAIYDACPELVHIKTGKNLDNRM